MTLEHLELNYFRSYENYEIELHQRLNLVIGPNGSGKTNLLEALYVLARAKSFRARDDELITHGTDWFRLQTQNSKHKWAVSYQQQPTKTKIIKLDQQPKKLEDYIGKLPVVLFEPTDLNIINGSPADRRRWLDAMLAGLDGRYFSTLVRYRRVLKQRNVLLRKNPSDLLSQLFAWDVKLAELGQYLYTERQKLIEYFSHHTNKQYQEISQHKATIKTSYISGYDGPAKTYAEWLLNSLNRHVKRDQILGHTGDGPHRDDVAIEFAGYPIQNLASRGEIRTMILVYKILELQFLESRINSRPLLLLDDVFSELDTRRRDYLLAKLSSYQSVVTATDLHGLKNNATRDHAIIRLRNPHARRRPKPPNQKS